MMGMMIDTKFEQMEEAFEQRRHEELEEAKVQGLKAVEAWVSRCGDNSKEIKYRLMKITKETACKILQGTFKTIGEIESSDNPNEILKITILYREQVEPLKETKVFVVETLFIDM